MKKPTTKQATPKAPAKNARAPKPKTEPKPKGKPKPKQKPATKPATQPRRNGRPPVILTDEQIEQIEKLSPVLTQEQMADFLGITDRTFRNKMWQDARVFSAYTRGRARAIGGVGANLVQRAMAGDPRATEFYLRTQAGWKDQTAAQTMMHVNLQDCTDEQLERIANGEDPARVLGAGAGAGAS